MQNNRPIGISRQRLKLKPSFSLICWGYITFIVIWFCLRLAWFDREWWLALLNTAALELFLPLLVLVPLTLVRKQWRLLVGLAIPLVLFLSLYGRLLLPPSPFHLVGGSADSFKVMSFNLLETNQQFGRIRTAIQEANPDIIGLQEVAPRHFWRIKEELSEYPYVEFQRGNDPHTVGILSRYPIVSAEPLPKPPVERGLRAVIDVNGRPVTAIVSHLEPYGKSLFPIKAFVRDVKFRYGKRQAEVSQLWKESSSPTMPTVLMCDCNMTETSQTYSHLRSSLIDSFPEAGWGFGFTYTLDLPKFRLPIKRIDYVWHSSELRATRAIVGDGPGSDHRPVIATLRFKD